MGNHHSTRDGIKTMHGVKHAHKLSKRLAKHNPITISYVCRHRKCKRLVDLLVENHPDGNTEFILGTAKIGGGFTRSHFVTKQVTWTDKYLIIFGATPNGTATLELKYHSKLYLSGRITYEKSGDQLEKKQFGVHAHLEPPPVFGHCLDRFDEQEFAEDRVSTSVDSFPVGAMEKETKQLTEPMK